jgi:hypothetical protein
MITNLDLHSPHTSNPLKRYERLFKVVSEPNREGILDVNWDGQILEMFNIDVDMRGTEIADRSAIRISVYFRV